MKTPYLRCKGRGCDKLGPPEAGTIFAGSGSVFDIGKGLSDDPSWKQSMVLVMESLKVTIFVTFCTFLALFMDDVRLAILPTSLDTPSQYISLSIMVSHPPPFPHSFVQEGSQPNRVSPTVDSRVFPFMDSRISLPFISFKRKR